ncbi:hypothetical protein CYMTET_39778 [Cymbomonas tetramitiformis]|uniref:Rhodanese domain-containing protein n=1 Tax=Cymbomonas tetramitiformis TaxID=36881 RepID=A0AAE0F3M4_9CHLO|nr:hypothetical protein CYMTET_39778 [Cymbomonas tetramitiformis]
MLTSTNAFCFRHSAGQRQIRAQGTRPAGQLFSVRRNDKRIIQCSSKSSKKRQSFKYDPAMQRWVKSKSEMAFDDPEFDPTVIPKSGSAYTLWPVVHSELMDRNLQSIDGSKALQMQKKGAIVVDVREAKQFEQCHIDGAINVPMFQPVQGNSTFDNLKRLAMAAFAMQATERNPNFREEALAALPKGKKLIVACATGGTLQTVIKRTTPGKEKEYADPERSFGKESRSLKGIFELYEAGFKDITHLEGGLNQWRYEDLPTFYAD